MSKSFIKGYLSLSSALLLTVIAGSLEAGECCDPCNCNRFYIGGFGGGMYPNSSKMYQSGTVFFTEATGGPLAVEARGHSNKKGTGFGGLQIGYEWARCLDSCSCWAVAPAFELEGYWLSRKIKGHLYDSIDSGRLLESAFLDSFHMRAGVYLASGVLSLNNSWGISPYLGGGVGATRLSLHKANALQLDPEEPGINHFNSRRNDSAWAFAAQIKAGLRYTICNFHIFGEYRYLFVDFSNYLFGSTAYPTHAPTTAWHVKFHNMQYNGFAFGIQYDL